MNLSLQPLRRLPSFLRPCHVGVLAAGNHRLASPQWRLDDHYGVGRTRNGQGRGLLTTTLFDPGFLSVFPANIIAALHAAGLPWLVALPASALFIRTALIYPMLHKHRKNTVKMKLLQPLIDARTSHTILQKQWSSRRTKSAEPSWIRRLKVASYQRREEIRLEQHFGSPTMRWGQKIVSLLILLATAESVRRLCGLSRGLHSILFGAFYSSIEKIHEMLDGTNLKASLDGPIRKYNEFQPGKWFQPSINEGGFPWCQDLTKPDPMHIVPVIFSSTFFASIWFNAKEVKRNSYYGQTGSTTNNETTETSQTHEAQPRRTFFQKVMLVVAAISIVPAWHAPVALLWYFVANVAIARLQTRHINRKFPIRIPPMACKTRAKMISSTDSLNLRKRLFLE